MRKDSCSGRSRSNTRTSAPTAPAPFVASSSQLETPISSAQETAIRQELNKVMAQLVETQRTLGRFREAATAKDKAHERLRIKVSLIQSVLCVLAVCCVTRCH